MFEELILSIFYNLIFPILVIYLAFRTLFSIQICKLCNKERGSINIAECGHHICKLCLHGLATKAMSEKKLNVKCPGNKNNCKHFICHEIILSILEEQEKIKFKELIDKSNEYIYCPNGACNNYLDQNGKSLCTLKTDIDSGLKFNCSKCKEKYCFKCKCVFHDNKSCKEYKQVNKINEDGIFKTLADLCKIKLKECPTCRKMYDYNLVDNSINCKSCKEKKILDLNKTKALENKRDEINNKKINYDSFEFKREEKFLNSSSSSKCYDEKNIFIDNLYSNSNDKFNTPNEKYRNIFSNINQSTSFKTVNNDQSNIKDIPDYNYDFSNTLNKLNETIYLDDIHFKDNLNQSNLSSSGLKTKTTAKYYGPGTAKKDGSLDMRFSENKNYVKNSKIEPTYETSGYYGSGQCKKDGTLDMRYSTNKQEVRSSLLMSGNFSSSSYATPMKSKEDSSKYSYTDNSNQSTNYSNFATSRNDDTRNISYSTNKNSYQNFPSASYMNHSGPLKKDGTPDMRYSVNKR